jgi:ankyrin repeat protein
LNAGADVNIANIDNKTPLDIAREHGYTEIIKLLTDFIH